MAALNAGITPAGEGIGGIVWNILGQTYKPVAHGDSCFAFDTLFPDGTFVPPHIHHLFSVCFTVLLTSILFSLGGLINAVFAKSFDDISIIPTFILTPLTYLGGVFYSISLLPPFWQGVSQVNPIIYMVNAFRYGFLGISDVPLGTAYLIIIGFIVALYGLAWWLISRGTGLRH